jgi:nitrogen regulatory protein PII
MEIWQLSTILAAPSLACAIRHKQFSHSCVWSNPAIPETSSPHKKQSLDPLPSTPNEFVMDFYETFMPVSVKWNFTKWWASHWQAPVRGGSAMKRIDAVIREQALDHVKTQLAKIGVEGLTVAEVKGFGQQRQMEVYRGTKYQVQFFPKLLLTIIARDDQASEIVEAIVEGARTGKIGDGKVFVSTLEEVLRIRSGEIGKAAI